VAGLAGNNKQAIEMVKKYSDSVVFTDFIEEHYDNLLLKSFNNQEEYICNLKNCNLFFCRGQTSFLADAFYNSKYSVVLVDLKDLECIINSTVSEKLQLSTSVYQTTEDLSSFINLSVSPNMNINCKFLHEKLEEL
jgi:hypothetical protein